MIYVISDLHGYPAEKFKALLRSAGFGGNDFLYVLGDVIDRNGDGGVGILRWLAAQPNAQLLLGNHEAMLLSCDFLFETVTDESINALSAEKLELLQNYLLNGGDPTLKALKNLPQEARLDLLDYLRDAPLYEGVTAGDRDYLLVHAGYCNFSPEKRLRDYSADDLLWARPEIYEDYYPDIVTVLGHTPTCYYGEQYRGKILKTDTWIDIDVGAGAGEPPVLLRLDDLKEFRLTEE